MVSTEQKKVPNNSLNADLNIINLTNASNDNLNALNLDSQQSDEYSEVDNSPVNEVK